MSVQVQWNLDYSAGSALSVALDVFRAASRNNVQPLAILACEKFGNTVAMCPDTCRKVEQAMKTPESTPIGFIRATVGFPADDCGSQLSKSLAGVQFLGLATALVSSLGAFEAGNVLEILLKSTTSDRTLLPTARQLKELLASLEPRCNTCGFTDSVVGWRIFLSSNAHMDETQRDFWKTSTQRPHDQGIEKLVDGIRQLARIGDANATQVRIKSTSCTPWVIAFTKWCLGIPPSIYLDDGTPILENPDSRVSIIASSDDSNPQGFGITIAGSVDNPTDLVASEVADCLWPYLMSIETYGKSSLQTKDLESGTAYRAACQAIPYSIYLVLQNLRFNKQAYSYDRFHSNLSLSPFPRDRIIMKVASQILELADPPGLIALDKGIEIADLPVVKMHLEMLSKNCLCCNCAAKRHNYSDGESFSLCSKEHFFRGLASTTADIMALSLFDHPESLLVCESYLRTGDCEFENAIHSIITGNGRSFCNIGSLLELALILVDHHDPSTTDAWMMSSKRGQTIYLRLYETCRIERRGYLTLSWLPGLIRYNGEVYGRVVGASSTEHPPPISADFLKIAVSSPCNLVPDLKLVWRVWPGDDYLAAALGVHGDHRDLSRFFRSPQTILKNLASVYFLEACSHSPESTLAERDPFCTYTNPLDPWVYTSLPNYVCVVAVRGDDRLRLLALNGGDKIRPMVLRKEGCLLCCLNFCREADIGIVIL